MKKQCHEFKLCKCIGANLKTIRCEKGISQENIANNANISVAHYRSIEQGSGNPTLQTLERISSELDMDLTDLLPLSLPDYPLYYVLKDTSLSKEDKILFNNIITEIIALLEINKKG